MIHTKAGQSRRLESAAIHHRKEKGSSASRGGDAKTLGKSPDENVWFIR
jgi:hypothetical protein